MKKICTLLLIFACSAVFAQDSLKTFNASRYQITSTGMEVLGSWGIANIGVGAVGWANSMGGQNRYFYQMDLIWGTVNLGAAILGYTNARKNKNNLLSPAESLKEQQKMERIFLINGALDVVYIGAGISLKDRGDSRNSAELRGYGSSIIVQGVFLLLFDGTMYSAHRRNGNKFRDFLEKNPVIFDGKKVGMVIHL